MARQPSETPGWDILSPAATDGVGKYDDDVTDAWNRIDDPPDAPGEGEARSADARLRELARQIEALREQPSLPHSSAIDAENARASTERGTLGEASPQLPQRAAREIDRLRAARAWRTKDLAITDIVAAAQRQATEVYRRLGELIELWEAHVPEEIAAHTRLTAVRGGVLHVAVDSSAIAYELDRFLREGLLLTLRQQHRRTLTRVKVTLAPMKPSHPDRQ
jgi:hypothetical protein